MQQQETNVRAVGAAGSLTVLIIWVLGFFAPEFLAAAPPGAEAALTTVIGIVACKYFPARLLKRGPKP